MKHGYEALLVPGTMRACVLISEIKFDPEPSFSRLCMVLSVSEARESKALHDLAQTGQRIGMEG
jgi:hypothetical protein